MVYARPPKTFDELVANPESRRAFSSVERKKIDRVLGPMSARALLRKNAIGLGLVMATVIAFVLCMPDDVHAVLAQQAAWWLAVAVFGPGVYFALQIPYVLRESMQLRRYLRRESAVSETPVLRQGLWTTKRFLWMIAVFLPLTCGAMVALVYSMGLLVLPGVVDRVWIGRAFVLPWTSAAALGFVCITVLFESSISAGILLKVHMLRTGERSIRIVEPTADGR